MTERFVLLEYAELISVKISCHFGLIKVRDCQSAYQSSFIVDMNGCRTEMKEKGSRCLLENMTGH